MTVAETILVKWNDLAHIEITATRLVLAAALGAVLGFERQREHKAAGLRTHMLVGLGSALFVLSSLETGMSMDHLSRVVQGLAVGIGFLGAGTIIKRDSPEGVKGLTTAATIWVTAAMGGAIGLGLIVPAIIAVFVALITLEVIGRLESGFHSNASRRAG